MTRIYRSPWFWPVIFVGYVLIALALARIQDGLPPQLEPLLVFVTSPLTFIFWPLHPLLGWLGFLEGDWWTLPSPAGILIGTLIYAATLYGLARLLQRIRNGS